jgi:pimeloyl-ACP methyl ester carboxylesterase
VPIEPFRVQVADEILDDLRRRLALTRFSDQIDGAEWDYGTDAAYLRELCRYWEQDYDWRAEERALNRFSQYTTEIDGQRIHFIHQRSSDDGALPLLVTHGWPGSVAEFSKIIDPLTAPGPDAFHVVAPSLPGYAFSGPTRERGWDTRRVAEAFAVLMADLGYRLYGAQGGDWGSMVSSQVALVDPAHVVGIHLNLVIAGPPEGEDFATLTEAEQLGLRDVARYQEVDSGYAKIQGTKPQTLGYGLNDSPAGLLAWIVEKFRTWSDCGGDVERSFTRDELLTNVMLYWVTATAHSSARLYYETQKSGRFGTPGERIEIPTGCAIFPREIARPPRRWAERQYNVVHWSEQPSGGHFAALEEPELLVDDVREFFRPLRGS